MSKPTEQELTMALEQAKHLRESGQDTHHLGKALLNCNYQMGHLLDVYHAVQQYLNSGMAQTEHARLLKAMDKARQVDDYIVHRERGNLGL